MIESITITNFQAHKKFTLELDPKITVVTGKSDAGKSAIYRALRWLCTNRPSGNEFIRWGTDGTRVKLRVDGRTIIRKRGKGNSYSLDKDSYEAFGSDVPEDIAKLLNLSEVSFQGQFDGPFWFDKTPGEVSRALNLRSVAPGGPTSPASNPISP